MTHHDPSKVAFGAVGSSDRHVTCEDGDPATFVAGLAVRLSTTGTLQLADDATASRIGISLGRSLSDTKKTAVCRAGNWVPIRLKDESVAAAVVFGNLTYTAKAKGDVGEAITVVQLDNQATAIAVVSVVGTAITVGMKASATTALTIKTAVDAFPAAAALVSVAVASGQGATAQAAHSVANLAGGVEPYTYVVKGTAVATDDTTGEASSDGDATGAVYLSGVLTGYYPDGTTAPAAYVDFVGGI